MIKAVDIYRELERLPSLENRGGDTGEEEVDAAFATLTDFRDGAIYAGSFSGCSGWERHLKGDEIVQILKGATVLDIVTDEGMQRLELSAGMLLVVPKGCWHRFTSEHGVSVMTATPQPTEHLFADDPGELPA